MKKLKDLIPLSHQIKIYVPSTYNISENVDNSEKVHETLSFLASLFGGATTYEAFGAWLSKQDGLIKERVTICESFCTESQLLSHIDAVYEYCEKLRDSMTQEAVALEVNSKLYFI